MNLKETLKALVEGKKIAHESWVVKGEYYQLVDNNLVTERGVVVNHSIIGLTQGFEIYQEPQYNLEEIYNWLKEHRNREAKIVGIEASIRVSDGEIRYSENYGRVPVSYLIGAKFIKVTE